MPRRSLLSLLADRRVTSWVRRNVFDGALPPFVRDFRPLNAALNRLWLGRVPLDFQREAWGYGPGDWARVWAAIAGSPTSTARASDTSEAEARWVAERVRAISPARVLEIGAGRGELARRVVAELRPGARLTLAEPFAEPFAGAGRPDAPGVEIEVVTAEAHALPFPDRSFDLVICAHTLEHLPRLWSTFAEIRRLAPRSLVIVPLQRWAPYTWDLHLHFFPYLEYLPGLLEVRAASMQVIDGDGCYELEHGEGPPP